MQYLYEMWWDVVVITTTTTTTTVTPHLSRNSSKQYTQHYRLHTLRSLHLTITLQPGLLLSLSHSPLIIGLLSLFATIHWGSGWGVFDWSRTWPRLGWWRREMCSVESEVRWESQCQSGLLWSIQRSQLSTVHRIQLTDNTTASRWTLQLTKPAGENTTLHWNYININISSAV